MSGIRLITPDKIELPEVLYKYRDWDNEYHKKVLTEGELFLSSPSMLNDPFDCNIPVAYYQLAIDKQLEQSYFNNFVRSQFPHFNDRQIQQEIQRLIDEGRHRDPNWIDETEKRGFEKLSKFYGVISFSELNNNVLMWSHYSNSHTGFCIGLKSRKLSFDKERKWMGGAIQYVDQYPIIIPSTDYDSISFQQLFFKSSIWEYEKEYRLLRTDAANTIEKIYEDDIAEIILGYAISHKSLQEILDIVDEKYPSVPIFKMQPIRYKFEFQPVRIK